MGTLASELAPIASELPEPRVYADANIPSGVVSYMRTRLRWDVFFVMEHPELRRARDIEHYRLARKLGRTLITLDKDYEDDRMFPPVEGAGVIVFSAPDERRFRGLLLEADRSLFRGEAPRALPLEGRKMRWSPSGPEGHDGPDGNDG